jgi:hypothetical protein
MTSGEGRSARKDSVRNRARLLTAALPAPPPPPAALDTILKAGKCR